MTQELAQVTSTIMSPVEYREAMEGAKAKPDILSEVVEDRKLYAIINGNKYLEVEA